MHGIKVTGPGLNWISIQGKLECPINVPVFHPTKIFVCNLKTKSCVQIQVSTSFQKTDIYKVFWSISKKVTSRHEVTALGITLGCHPDDVDYYIINYDVRDAAYKFLCWTKDNCGPVERWEKIIEALETIEKNNAIPELGLKERLAAARRVIRDQEWNFRSRFRIDTKRNELSLSCFDSATCDLFVSFHFENFLCYQNISVAENLFLIFGIYITSNNRYIWPPT